MASTIHDERPSTSSSYVSENNSKRTSSPSTTTRPSTTSTTMTTAVPLQQQQQQYWQGPHSNNIQGYTNFPRNIGHWQPHAVNGNGFDGRGFNQIPNWTLQQQSPRNFLPHAPFYIQQQNAPPPPPQLQWNAYGGYSFAPQQQIIHPQQQQQQQPPPWIPPPPQQQQHQSQTLKSSSNNLTVIVNDNSREQQQQQQQKPSGPNECWNNAVVAWEQRTMIHNKIGLIINDRYRIVQNIDSGSYGTIFVAEDLKKNNERVAVKFDAASKDDHLKYEYEVYKSALYDDGCVKIEGFPRVHWFGNQFGHNVLVMELLGPPISSLFNFCERKFGLQTILLLGEQMIRRIKHLHHRGFIHRDLKLENFLMGLAENDTICYLIDFGLARRYRYRDGRQLKHIPFRKGRSFVGTAKYASLNSHKNAELSRRDDVESLGYVLIELINGSLPWKKLKVRNAYSTKHQMYIKIRNMKEQASWADICPAMVEWMNYCKKLSFTDEPDYDHLLKILRKIPEVIKSNVKKDLGDALQDIDLCINDDDPRCSQCRQRDGKVVSTTSGPAPATITKMFKDKNESSNGSSSSSDNETPIICNEKLGRERKLSKSASMSIVNTLNPQESLSTIPTTKPYADSVSDSKTAPLPQHHLLEDDTASITSTCRKCRQRRQKYLDDRCAATGAKYSWQVWKEATPELKFQYENRFSWTLPEYQIQDNRLLQNQPIYFQAQPPPSLHQQLQQQQQQNQIQQNYQLKQQMLFSAPPPPLRHQHMR